MEKKHIQLTPLNNQDMERSKTGVIYIYINIHQIPGTTQSGQKAFLDTMYKKHTKIWKLKKLLLLLCNMNSPGIAPAIFMIPEMNQQKND